MAKRRSGNVTVSISWLDSQNQYRAVVHAGGKKKIIYVGHPPASRLSVDSPAAYDSAAGAAISFAEHEGLDVQPDYDERGSRYVLKRVAGGKKGRK
jgi:hypothetical protein